MKAILSAIIALLVLIGAAAFANAADFPKAHWANQAFPSGQGS